MSQEREPTPAHQRPYEVYGSPRLKELQSVKGPMGLPIERDLHFEPKSLRELRDQHKKDRG